LVKVCILTAGKGSRLGNYGKIINKAILPIREKAILSHILEMFSPNYEFVIGVGYRSDDIKNYLKIAHPNLNIKFVKITNYSGTGSGPGRSLLYCKKLLQQEFFFVPCDILSNIKLKSTKSFKSNIFWCSSIKEEKTKQYLNFKHENSKIIKFVDKKTVSGKNFKSWSGLCYIKDYKIFWKSLKNEHKQIDNDYQISNGLNNLIKLKNCKIKKIIWKDLGNLENYECERKKTQKFDFSKDKEFIYFINNKVIKFSKNPKDAKNKFLKFKFYSKCYPKNVKLLKNFLYYEFVNGENFYDVSNKKLFSKLLTYLDKNLWKKSNVNKIFLKKKCLNFYKIKTFQRVNLFLKKMREIDKINYVNNLKVFRIKEILDKINWNNLYKGKPYYIHGDLQFDNIIKTENKFKLIDWRSDFDGEIKYGDIHYDFAKILGGIYLNYKEVKKNNFSVQINKNTSKLRFSKCNRYNDILRELKKFIYNKNIDFKKIEILQALIYLNMSPLHKPPFSIGLFLLAKYLLIKKL
tara:strand:+ start:7759 stop:9315 length:1557 start_codon:yes stop_codon:yes gene_type:complete